ncbi:GntR family transcriptional regulator [Subtercola boreus]|uniref:GntR family transcriptional regulator n=1 Tax=Subtercola boreus TaxID=120213 RepID=A0A3E0WAT2_9MICO|nr:GntR family transcriptional regulator [Subtercola boreus]RFA19048.1 GntR family transcriptional regulator [Subtercola boreus]RFA19186.1 GntR family transcriptional regulator [Subtercola boreus]RFA25648.1 GntR family transcriptional regulator [Subtercola boreus]
MASRASDRAYELLRDEILDWQLGPGTTLGEVETAARLGISRTPLRAALGRLQADGLLSAESGRGLVVTAVSTENVAELFELRQALEQQAARLAAARRDPQVFKALLDGFREAPALLGADDPGRHAYYDLVREFDRAVDEAVQSSYLVAALAGLRIHLARVRRLSKDNPERLLEAAAEHRMIVQAIHDGDAELASHATHVHLAKSFHAIVEAAAPAQP